MKKFPDKASAVTFFEEQIWGDKPVCPYCNSENTAKRTTRYGHRCRSCRRDFTVRTGTIFEKSRLPLHKWLYAMYLVVTARKGISSLQLSKEIDVTQKTVWFLLQRLREACTDESSVVLRGIVEANQVYLGGKEKNEHDDKRTKGSQERETKTKVAVVGLRERGYHGTFRHFSKKDVDRYVNEFTFRLNQGSCQVDTEDRMKSLITGSVNKHISYRELVS